VLISALPNELARRAAMRLDVVKCRVWVTLSVVLALVFCVTRALEFTALNCSWDTNAYGSVVWTLLGLHTAHVVTDAVDTGVLAAILFVGPLDANRFVDIAENSLYYYFVIASWLPIYAVIYFAPRLS
jgi:heme/copper-type cytochrome/quinol oxidase subunit 3